MRVTTSREPEGTTVPLRVVVADAVGIASAIDPPVPIGYRLTVTACGLTPPYSSSATVEIHGPVERATSAESRKSTSSPAATLMRTSDSVPLPVLSNSGFSTASARAAPPP